MPANRDEKGRFIKGASGNSTGRPKTPEEFKRLAKEKSIDTLKAVIAIIEKPEINEAKDIISAARLIIEYAYGKPQQDVSATVNTGGDFTLEIVSDKENATP
ncbi:MAG: DUF5681 domain-containing protein [Eubacteriales bacterium]|nr:DUF5681 domain-containing protein [Eubacteriales bacterium]MDD3882496.1 DUF5681 domain-containing protein [Eubacteriales bacterium]MDD4512796.1 DUF5681 domain-containing protein [Eubacteriales bacterium]